MGFNFEMTPMLIGLFSNGVLFVVGYVVSVLFGGMRPDITGLTRQSGSGSEGVATTALFLEVSAQNPGAPQPQAVRHNRHA